MEKLVLRKSQKFYLFWKRVAGIFGSSLAILLLSLLLILVAIVQKCTSKGPVLFIQERCGKGGKPFKLYKFRSMKVDAPHNETSEHLENPDQYITRFGKFLRKTSIDELPQLFNILKGDMAFIGPRPLIYEDKETLDIRMQNGSINLRPGMSGLAQIQGRVNLDPKTKGELDGEYYKKVSLGLDAIIFFKTIGKVFTSADVEKKKTKKKK